MKTFSLSITIFLLLIPAAWSQSGPVNVPVEGPFLKTLSEYNLFKDAARQVPNDGVLPYDLNTPLFSDYTTKYRFVWIPPGKSATYHDDEIFSFPVGTVIAKSFSYLRDLRDASVGEKIIETRLLVHRTEGWVGLPYMWEPDMSDAKLKVAGSRVDVTWLHYDGSPRTNNYIVPNLNQCKSCHEQAGVLVPIGPKARNLNKPYAYAHGSMNQLSHWADVGYLSGAPDPEDAPRLPIWDKPETGSLNDRARAWLEINCMHCHNLDGPGSTAGLELSFSEKDPRKIGVMKPPVAAGPGTGGRLFDVVPGKPDESILIYRLESTHPGVMMPELPRRLVDEEGTELIRQWVLELGEEESE